MASLGWKGLRGRKWIVKLKFVSRIFCEVIFYY
jgi:hypothetical protein